MGGIYGDSKEDRYYAWVTDEYTDSLVASEDEEEWDPWESAEDEAESSDSLLSHGLESNEGEMEIWVDAS